jgi:hypothetical protein
VAVAKRRAALLARLRVARRRPDSEQFRFASMTSLPRCGRLRVRQHGSVSCWWSLLGGRPHVGHEAAAVHHAARRRGSMAARGARAGSSRGADDRACRLERGSLEPMDGSLRGAIADLTEIACVLRRYPRSPKLFLPRSWEEMVKTTSLIGRQAGQANSLRACGPGGLSHWHASWIRTRPAGSR